MEKIQETFPDKPYNEATTFIWYEFASVSFQKLVGISIDVNEEFGFWNRTSPA